MNRSYAHEAEPQWFIQAQGRVWGPYPESRMEGFIAEGRVAAATLVSQAPEEPFAPAGRAAALRPWFGTPTPAPTPPHDRRPSAPAMAEPEPATRHVEPGVYYAGAMRPLLVFAALGSLEGAAFEAVLAIHGPYERIGGGLWLIRARLGPAALRNALSRRLRGGDTLVVVEATLEQTAWFNLDLAEERKLRALWAG